MRTSTDELLSDDPFYTVVGNSIQGSYFPDTAGSTPTATTTTGSVMSVNAGGITINLILDAAAQAAPVGFKNGLQQAVAILAANITDKITVNINIDYSGTGGGAAAGPDSGLYENYSWVRSELVNNARSGDTTFNSLPSGIAIQGQSNVAVWNAQLKLWGVIGANDTTTDDASAYFSTDINPNLLVGVALHELTHAMGRVPYGSAPDVFDFYRFTSPGAHLFSGAQTAPAAYFSLDGGNTKLADYGQSSDPSDFLNSGVQGPDDPFNEYYSGGTIQGLTAIDLKQLDALGFHVAVSAPTTIEAYGTTSLLQFGNSFFMNPVSGDTGPELKYGGSPVTLGEFGAWTPIGAEQTSSGYEIAWQTPGTSQFIIWYTDSSGNYQSNSGAVSGTSGTLEQAETIFHQDLNGDGIIGVPKASPTIEAYGSTGLVQSGSNFYMNPVAGGTGPELKYGGSPVTAGQFGAWTPVGAEHITSGYEVAWQIFGTDQFTVWTTDSNGNFTSNTGAVSGTSTTLEQAETVLQQDLNGDGTIGVPVKTIEVAGSTSLVQNGSNFYMNPIGGGSGVELKYGGSLVVAGQFGAWTPVGSEHISSGYEVAWQTPGTDQFTVWTTDSNGNFASNTGAVSGTGTTLEQAETVLQQDLNGDGTIGVPVKTIEVAGSTSLVQNGSNFYMNPIGGGSGVELKYGGSLVVAGQFGAWTPVGSEHISSGYEVAWQTPGTDQFTVWTTDSNGNFASNTGAVSGTGTTLEQAETVLQQDLNGDGTIGVSMKTIEAAGSTSLVERSSNFYFNPVAGGTGPELKYGGSPVVAGQFGAWAPVGVEQISSGYEVAWQIPGTDQFTVWTTDSNGNFTSNTGAVSGNSATVQQAEIVLHQDLNGDGLVGVHAASVPSHFIIG
ncbi:NF038122 family metalloprotease [Bradyrhizobium sp. GCM10023182]|uniref:NF038122 family metalloprotease n=1 Tax=Bradyrhizobium zhengyangense TaxID=2911009 RepID=A0ABS9LX54_9BRAD|nr:NF038122 family metalloprotease [Bradyrhizobium zhengyangense]MCG2671612.1 NF038122 family metalloprotease [Bradyrhizobium zhengyangense]